jgi:CheY-like chemotaxis protein
MDQPAKKLEIMIVDDDELILAVLREMVEELGHVATAMLSAVKALEILQAGQPVDLIITDMAMPEMSGLALLSAARAIRPDLAIVISTGYDRLPDDADGSIYLLRKPYAFEDLSEAILICLR